MCEYWREERQIIRNTDLYNDLIDSALPDESTSDKYIPNYMVDFYEESNLSIEWLNTPDTIKLFMLDVDIDNYMSTH